MSTLSYIITYIIILFVLIIKSILCSLQYIFTVIWEKYYRIICLFYSLTKANRFFLIINNYWIIIDN